MPLPSPTAAGLPAPPLQSSYLEILPNSFMLERPASPDQSMNDDREFDEWLENTLAALKERDEHWSRVYSSADAEARRSAMEHDFGIRSAVQPGFERPESWDVFLERFKKRPRVENAAVDDASDAPAREAARAAAPDAAPAPAPAPARAATVVVFSDAALGLTLTLDEAARRIVFARAGVFDDPSSFFCFDRVSRAIATPFTVNVLAGARGGRLARGRARRRRRPLRRRRRGRRPRHGRDVLCVHREPSRRAAPADARVRRGRVERGVRGASPLGAGRVAVSETRRAQRRCGTSRLWQISISSAQGDLRV